MDLQKAKKTLDPRMNWLMLLADVTYSADGSQQHVRKIWKETQETLDSKLVWRMRRPRNPFTFMFSNSDTDSGKNQSTQLIEYNFGAFINLLLCLLVVGYAN